MLLRNSDKELDTGNSMNATQIALTKSTVMMMIKDFEESKQCETR